MEKAEREKLTEIAEYLVKTDIEALYFDFQLTQKEVEWICFELGCIFMKKILDRECK